MQKTGVPLENGGKRRAIDGSMSQQTPTVRIGRGAAVERGAEELWAEKGISH